MRVPAHLSMAAFIACLLFTSDSIAKAGWKQLVSFKFKNVNYQIKVSDQMKPDAQISGVAAGGKFKDFEKTFAYHNIAWFNKFDGYGPSKELLAEAAKAANRQELKYAGAIVTGCSQGGRRAAQWAGFNSARALAVLLDHSWTTGRPDTKPVDSKANLPILPGIPMCFTASKDDKFQGFDRRTLHFNWCKTAYTKYKQPCTSTIFFESTKHCRIGSTEFQQIWLKEALVHRLPKQPSKGTFNYQKPYRLRPVSIATGGTVFTKIISAEGRSLHSDCVVGKANRQYTKFNFWLPGPESGAKYVEWVKKNKGRVSKDASKTIPKVLKP